MYQVHGGPDGTFNQSGHRVGVIRSKKLNAKNPNEDPYFLAMIIAMAQVSSHWNIMSRKFTARLLSIAEDEKAFVVYTATVPSGLISKFNDPFNAPTNDSDITIEYTKVPVHPILGFRERLGEALGSDIVGDLDAALADWEDGKPEPAPLLAPKPSTQKRKRAKEAVDDYLTTSFSENRNPPDLRPPLKRRHSHRKSRPLVQASVNT